MNETICLTFCFKAMVCWLIMAGKLYAFKVNSKSCRVVKDLLVIVTSHYKNVCSCNRLTVVVEIFIFVCLLLSFLTLPLTTMSFDIYIIYHLRMHILHAFIKHYTAVYYLFLRINIRALHLQNILLAMEILEVYYTT